MSNDNNHEQAIAEKILPVLEEFETRRKACVGKFKMAAGITAVLAVIAIGAMLSAGASPMAALFAVVIAAIICAVAYHFTTSDYRRDFKDCVVRGVIEAYDDSLRYSPGNHIREHQFRESELFKKGIDRFRGEDHISGKIEKTDFEFSEIHAEYKTTTRDSKGRRRTQWHTIFKGIFFIGDFHKDFRTHTVVLPDSFEKAFGFLGQKLQEMNFMRGELIKLEDPEFEREFAVYGDDQVEARYILSTSLMRRILGYKQKFGGKVYISFLHSKIYVALSTSKNHFEPKVFTPVNDASVAMEFLADLELVLDIIHDLNLNTRIWSKE